MINAIYIFLVMILRYTNVGMEIFGKNDKTFTTLIFSILLLALIREFKKDIKAKKKDFYLIFFYVTFILFLLNLILAIQELIPDEIAVITLIFFLFSITSVLFTSTYTEYFKNAYLEGKKNFWDKNKINENKVFTYSFVFERDDTLNYSPFSYRFGALLFITNVILEYLLCYILQSFNPLLVISLFDIVIAIGLIRYSEFFRIFALVRISTVFFIYPLFYILRSSFDFFSISDIISNTLLSVSVIFILYGKEKKKKVDSSIVLLLLMVTTYIIRYFIAII